MSLPKSTSLIQEITCMCLREQTLTLCFHECSQIGMDVNIKPFHRFHRCNQSLMPSSNNLLNNFELECEQDHEYFLNWLLFSRWGSCELSPFVQGSELFSLLLPGSLHQFSCELSQLHQICPSTILGETDVHQNISWKNTAQPQWWRVQSFNLLAFMLN